MKSLLLALEAKINALSPARRHALAFVAIILSILGIGYVGAQHVDVQVDTSQWVKSAPGGAHRLGATVPFSTVVAGGDLGGHFPNPNVSKANGTTISTAGGALATGAVLRATGTATADWGTVNLASTAAVTGTLPKGNQGAQDVGGDLSGSTSSATVAKVNGTSYGAGGSLTTGTIPRVTASSTVAYGALDLANTSAVTGLLPLSNLATGFIPSTTLKPKSTAHYGFRCDFVSPVSGSYVTSTIYEGDAACPNWAATQANSATGMAVAAVNTATEIGVITLGTGAQTTGASTLSNWSSISGGPGITLASANAVYALWRVATTTASDGSNTFVSRVGLGDTLNATEANGIWFEWDTNTNTHFVTKTCSGGAGNVVTVQTTGVVAGTGFHDLEITKPAGSTTVTFTIDGADQSSTGTAPTSAPVGMIAMIVKSAGGTARTLSIDAADFDHTWATPR